MILDVSAPYGSALTPVLETDKGLHVRLLGLNNLRFSKEMVVGPGATHFSKEPGALERVGELGRDGFFLRR